MVITVDDLVLPGLCYNLSFIAAGALGAVGAEVKRLRGAAFDHRPNRE